MEQEPKAAPVLNAYSIPLSQAEKDRLAIECEAWIAQKTRQHNEQIEFDFIQLFHQVAQKAHKNSVDHGFWETSHKDPLTFKLSRIALMHSELSECLEGIRKNLKDDHLPEHTMEVAELADVIIRIFDYAEGYDLPLGRAVIEKMKYNSTRPYKHSKLA